MRSRGAFEPVDTVWACVPPGGTRFLTRATWWHEFHVANLSLFGPIWAQVVPLVRSAAQAFWASLVPFHGSFEPIDTVWACVPPGGTRFLTRATWWHEFIVAYLSLFGLMWAQALSAEHRSGVLGVFGPPQ